jgi:hypothetical protein
MLETIVEVHGIDPSFWELPSCFYQRDDDFEDVFCVPYTMLRKGSIIGSVLVSFKCMKRKC